MVVIHATKEDQPLIEGRDHYGGNLVVTERIPNYHYLSMCVYQLIGWRGRWGGGVTVTMWQWSLFPQFRTTVQQIRYKVHWRPVIYFFSKLGEGALRWWSYLWLCDSGAWFLYVEQQSPKIQYKVQRRPALYLSWILCALYRRDPTLWLVLWWELLLLPVR